MSAIEWKILAPIKFLSRVFAPAPVSIEYRAWRSQFLLDRLKIALWIAVPTSTALIINGLYTLYGDSTQFDRDLLKMFEDPSLSARMRSMTWVNIGVNIVVLSGCWVSIRSRWGRARPVVIFFLLSSILTWSDMLVGTLFGIPSVPDGRFFLAQAVIMPVYWRWHLISQLIPIAHYVFLYPLLGLTKIGTREFYNFYIVAGRSIDWLWIGTISILSAYLYERLKRSEFESQRQLDRVIYAISHDLKTPATSISVALQGLLLAPAPQLAIDRQILQQLLATSERQIELITSLLVARSIEAGELVLYPEPSDLGSLVGTIVAELAPIASQHRSSIATDIAPDLPVVNIDKTQIWRVFNNLIANAIDHNPSGTQIEISIAVISDRLHCTVSDDGIGIPADRLPHVFELYTRGIKARRMPGLGLGLYLCQQIVRAHQGEIGVTSELDRGSTFWFTLPIGFQANRIAKFC